MSERPRTLALLTDARSISTETWQFNADYWQEQEAIETDPIVIAVLEDINERITRRCQKFGFRTLKEEETWQEF